MHSDRISRWLTLGANIGVVIGLGVLIFEVQQNQELTRAQIHQDRADTWVSNNFTMADSEFLAPVLEKVYDAGFPNDMNATDGLTPLEMRRIRIMVFAYYGDYGNLFYQYQHGYLDADVYKHAIEDSIRALAPWWRKHGVIERPDFKQEVDRILSSD